MVRLPAQTQVGPDVKIHTHFLRVLHKWLGLIIGIQFLLWTLSGTAMALIDMEEVSGGPRRDPPQIRPVTRDAWPTVQKQLAGTPVKGLVLRPLLERPTYQVTTPDGIRLFDAETARAVRVDEGLARRIAAQAYAGGGPIRSVKPLQELTLAVREHELPIWRIDFADKQNSSFYVSGSTGALLERRNDSWRLWDFFWMLHNMDYANRTSFNHPLIITVGFAAVWLAISGLYLLFRTGWRSDFKRRKPKRLAGKVVG